MVYYVMACIAFGLDQLTKYAIVRMIPLYETRSVIGDFFLLTSHRNRGAAFSILQNQRWFFVSITIVVMVGLVWYIRRLIKTGKKLLPFAMSLVLGGAAGNFIDRLFFGEVVDFLQFNFKFTILGQAVDYTFPIFKVSD
jgi:signal peptidase II